MVSRTKKPTKNPDWQRKREKKFCTKKLFSDILKKICPEVLPIQRVRCIFKFQQQPPIRLLTYDVYIFLLYGGPFSYSKNLYM